MFGGFKLVFQQNLQGHKRKQVIVFGIWSTRSAFVKEVKNPITAQQVSCKFWKPSYLLQNPTYWLNNAPWFHCSTGDTWEQWCERKVIPWWNDLDIIQFAIKIPHECGASPASPKNHNFLLFRSFGLVWLSVCIRNEASSTTANSANRESSAGLQIR
jgi:hypothetical protein